jgi:hypothetical protein
LAAEKDAHHNKNLEARSNGEDFELVADFDEHFNDTDEHEENESGFMSCYKRTPMYLASQDMLTMVKGCKHLKPKRPTRRNSI